MTGLVKRDQGETINTCNSVSVSHYIVNQVLPYLFFLFVCFYLNDYGEVVDF